MIFVLRGFPFLDVVSACSESFRFLYFVFLGSSCISPAYCKSWVLYGSNQLHSLKGVYIWWNRVMECLSLSLTFVLDRLSMISVLIASWLDNWLLVFVVGHFLRAYSCFGAVGVWVLEICQVFTLCGM